MTRRFPLQQATTPRYRRGRYSIPWIALLYSLSLTYKAEWMQGWYQVPFFVSLVWLDLGLNPDLPNHWRTLYQWAGKGQYSSVQVSKPLLYLHLQVSVSFSHLQSTLYPYERSKEESGLFHHLRNDHFFLHWYTTYIYIYICVCVCVCVCVCMCLCVCVCVHLRSGGND